MSDTGRQVVEVPGVEFPEWYPSSTAVTAGPFVFTASLSAVDWSTGTLAPAARVEPGLPNSSGHPVKLQVREVYQRLSTTLEAAGSGLDLGVSINQWHPSYHGPAERHEPLRDPYELFWEKWRYQAHAYIQSRDEFLLADRPASCLMPMDRLVSAEELIEVQLVALRAGSGITKRAYAHDVHSPLGGYSVGVESGPWVFSAGFIATDFETGLHPNARVPHHIWYGNQVAAEVEETLRQIRITMEASGARWDNVVKVVTYLTPHGIRNMPAVDEVFAKQWPEHPPARAIVPVTGIGGVNGGNVEIFVIVARPEHGGEREVVHAPGALAPLGHEAQAIRSGPLLFLSTQLGRTATGPSADTLRWKSGAPHTRRHIADQVARIQDNVQRICEAAGTSIENTVKADVYLTDMADLGAFAGAWTGAFSSGLPASGFFEAPPSSHEVPGCDVAVDLVVHCP
nr:hypothetical protein GCM10020063_007130 [Dactylosporangium thailandense]